MLDRAAAKFFAPNSVVCRYSSESTAHDEDRLEIAELQRLGYEVHEAGRGGWEIGVKMVRDIVASPRYLLPGFMAAIRSPALEIADACEPALIDPAWARTVNGWGRRLGYSDRHGLEALLRRHEVTLRPWATLNWARILSMVDWVIRQPEFLPLSQVAEHFGMGNRKDLNRWAHRVTGFRFLELVEMGPRRMLRLLAERSRDAG